MDAGGGRGQEVEVGGRRLLVRNLDKVLWPEDGYTKADLISYYLQVAPVMLPHLRDRPLVLTRYPDGIHGAHFYQKDLPDGTPDWVASVPFLSPSTGRVVRYCLCPDAATLAWLGSQACLEIHPWLSRTSSPSEPDFAVLDIDPAPPAGFAEARRLALALGGLLERLKLSSALKTSGATGLHIYVPLLPGHTYPGVREFVRRVAVLLYRTFPRMVTLERTVRRRAGRVYLDYLQNVRGKTLVAPYGVRPLPGAPVSTPITWQELIRVDPAGFTLSTVPARVRAVGDLFAPALGLGHRLDFALLPIGGLEPGRPASAGLRGRRLASPPATEPADSGPASSRPPFRAAGPGGLQPPGRRIGGHGELEPTASQSAVCGDLQPPPQAGVGPPQAGASPRPGPGGAPPQAAGRRPATQRPAGPD
ncbi:MAG: non-homologous end-joining DNA ligase [Acetobacteraceae bacterium]|nr:non-homologous end-joining DNA ligase [Acetobacteraceae bacterium]